MHQPPAHFDPKTLTYWRPFNIRYQVMGTPFEVTIMAESHDHAELMLLGIKRNGYVAGQIVAVENNLQKYP